MTSTGSERHPLVDELTLEEKAGLVSGGSFWATRAVERLGIGELVLTDGPHGVRMQSGGVDHLGINDSRPHHVFPGRVRHRLVVGPRAAARDGPSLLAAEALAPDVDVLLGPGDQRQAPPAVRMKLRVLLGGPVPDRKPGGGTTSRASGRRGSGRIGEALRREQPGDGQDARLGRGGRADAGEVSFQAFETIVTQERPATVMSSYNKVNGTYASESRQLLTGILKGEWGFDGFVVSDWGGVHDPEASLAAGLDLEMPTTGATSPDAVADAVRSGRIEVSALDDAVSRILSVRDRLLASRVAGSSAVDDQAHHALARRVAAESAVLLVNDGGLLPLATSGGAVAVIGELARTPRYQGEGSSHVAAYPARRRVDSDPERDRPRDRVRARVRARGGRRRRGAPGRGPRRCPRRGGGGRLPRPARGG